jgi:hypothetical protein
MANQFVKPSGTSLPPGSGGQVVLKGLHSGSAGKFDDSELIFPIQDGPTGLGDPITADAAVEMITKWQASNANANEAYVDFGKETLLLLLSQAGCEGVRFYFCKNHQDNISLILTGYDKDLREIDGSNIGNLDKKQPLIIEVGGGGKKTDIAVDITASEPKCLLYKYFTEKSSSNSSDAITP